MVSPSQRQLEKYGWSLIHRAAPPKRAADERVCDYQEIYREYDEETVRAQAARCIQCPTPGCVQGCPLNNRIPEWLALAAAGEFLEAAAVSRSTSNMPEICSRVCPQEKLCEGSCILNARSDPVAIGAVERFINEYAFRHAAPELVQAVPNGRRVAVIGSGPGGLACADELAKAGCAVTVFESLLLPGGLLVNGIPSFKLEKHIVSRRVDLLSRRGVEFRLGVRVGWDVSLEGLRARYDAVFLGIGAQKPKPLDIPGAGLRGVVDALPFLVPKNVDSPLAEGDHIDVAGKRVAVLGGGDTAMDCLRTALRSGASEVTCLYRRDLANMPGSRKEYANAIEEGARFQFLTNPTELLDDGSGAVVGVRCVRMELGAPDASGRRKPRAVPGSEFTLAADVVLVAYGFDPVPFPEGSDFNRLEFDDWDGIRVDAQQMTSLPGVFAGGDSVRGPSLVVHAVRDGRRAALGIMHFLATAPLRPA
ncbi:MAG: NAD(P)-dependent oxidoreductase [Candidatus Didemnitutus sp.]|nr:NAD(P)-dependent oxidoreductase [Candidatus Didemnitutus sp.]